MWYLAAVDSSLTEYGTRASNRPLSASSPYLQRNHQLPGDISAEIPHNNTT
jgi:hypothetical protein